MNKTKHCITIALLLLFIVKLNAKTVARFDSLKSTLTFLMANDTGANGYYYQKQIANTMGEVANDISPDAVLAAGDIHHFYGVESVSDPLWMTNYELIYSHPALMIPWYAIPGNHEYQGNVQAVIDYSKVSRRWNMPSRYYTKTFNRKGVTMRIVMIDSTPLIDRYRNEKEKYPEASLQDRDAQLNWIDSVLSVAKEDWIVVMGHHPIYCGTEYSMVERDNMKRVLLPIFKKHKVDLYASGHIHSFQYLRPQKSNTDYLVNSAGFSSYDPYPDKDCIYMSNKPGFSVITFNDKAMKVFMIDKDGNILHSFTKKNASKN